MKHIPLICATSLTLAFAATANVTALQYDGLPFGQEPETLKETGTATEENDSTSIADYEYLDELVITANKKVIQTDGVNVTYNVSEDESSQGQTALDMLKKVPFVTVDGEDNIKIKGQGSFKVLINGHENTAMSSNLSQILKSMPAGSIEKVEVINEPGAKYDAEGLAGVLNIVMSTKTRDDAYSLGINLNYSVRDASASLNGNIKKGKVAADFTAVYANGGGITPFSNENDNVSDTYYLKSDKMHHLRMNTNQPQTYDYLSVGANVSYEPDERNLFTANFFYNDIDAKLKQFDSFSEMFDIKDQLQYSFRTSVNGGVTFGSLSAGANYDHFFRTDGTHKLTIAYLYNRGVNSTHTDYHIFDDVNYDVENRYQWNNNDQTSHEHTVQADYTNSFDNSRHTIEAGAKIVVRRNDGTGRQTGGESASTSVEIENSDIRQKQDVYAGYASYSLKFSDFIAKAGIRYEHTAMGMDFLNGSQPDFMKHLNDVVPNASLTRMFGPASNIRLGYSMRISRPDLNSVNPYLMKLIPNFAKQGNPDLGCEKINKISLTYTNFGRIVGGSIGVEYMQNSNAIVSGIKNEGEMIISTEFNDGKIKQIGVSGMLNVNFTQTMNLGVSGNVSYARYSCPESSNKGWTGNFNINYGAALGAGIRLNAYGGMSTKTYHFIGNYSGYHYYGLGLSRAFLKDDALTIGINASGFLEGHTVFSMYSRTSDIISKNRMTRSNWNVGINIGWRLGGRTQGAKKSSVKVENDDVSKSKSANGGVGL